MEEITLIAKLGDEVLPPDACASLNQAYLKIEQFEANAISRGISERNYTIKIGEPVVQE